MKVFAYCCASFREATRRAAGVEPLLSPPVSADDFNLAFNLAWLESMGGPETRPYDRLLYFDLHGEPGEPFWRGDKGIVALTASQVRETDLSGAVVFALSCYLADEDSPMLDALLDAGAEYVIGGDGANYAGRQTVWGAGRLGLWVRVLMQLGMEPLRALAVGKKRLEVTALKEKTLGREKRLRDVKDTLTFRAYYRREK